MLLTSCLTDQKVSRMSACERPREIHRSPLQPNMSENESQRGTKDVVHTKGKIS